MKTAVEWLIEEMLKQGYFDANKQLTFTNLDHLQQQAKEMERKQQEEFTIKVLEFYHNSLFMIPLKDGEAKWMLKHIKKEL